MKPAGRYGRLRRSLEARLVLLAVVTVTLISLSFALMLVALARADEASTRADQQEVVVTAAVGVRDLLVALQTNRAGLLLSGDPHFRRDGLAAAAELERAADRLELIDDQRTKRLASLTRAYLSEWERPIQDAIARDRIAAMRMIGTGVGLRMAAAISGVVDEVTAEAERSSDDAVAAERSAEHLALAGAGSLLVISLVMFPALVAYVRQRITRPLAGLSQSTRRLAAGDHSVVVPVSGNSSIDEVAIAFNRMVEAIRAAQASLQHETEVLSAIVHGVPVGVAFLDVDGRGVMHNAVFSEFWSLVVETPSDPIDAETLSLRGSESLTDPAGFREAIAAGEKSRIVTVTHADSNRVFGVYCRRIESDPAARAGRLVVTWEVTAERQALELTRRLLRDVSHELRTPLTGITLIAEVLAEGRAQSETVAEYHTLLHAECVRLTALLDDLLGMQRLEGSQAALRLVDVDLVEIIRHQIALAVLEPEQEEITLNALDSAIVPGDRERLTQVVGNLLSNAVKYGGGSQVAVSVTVDGAVARVEVADGGEGVARHLRDRIFEPFFRGHATEGIPGTGLGLSICRAIIRAHGGEIGVEADPSSGGATFWFAVPRSTTGVTS
jgi:two-component system, NtrC family, sensor histidine kinase KinB